MGLTLTILSENYTIGMLGIKAEHGFSVLVEKDGHVFLYDTGQLGICVDNARALKKDLTKLQKIFLSHGHSDHTGGLEKVLEEIGRPMEIVAHPDIFRKRFSLSDKQDKYSVGIPFIREYWEKTYDVTLNLHEHFYSVEQGVWLTGVVPFSNDIEKIPPKFVAEINGEFEHDLIPDDNTLVIDTAKGLVVVLGCGHRGIVNILTYINKKIDKKIYAVIGGTHLHNASPEHLNFILTSLRTLFKENETKLFAVSHCTGIDIYNEFTREFKDITHYASAGMTFEF
jgi:7,8-dihydropterin-6-yl-methyl-4-(beta-D-ribofuranosyl)aminobenzene 5'-phosphate synthase